MKNGNLKMDMFGGLLMADIQVWNKKKDSYGKLSITVDTGATITTLSKDILYRCGYNVSDGDTKRVTTASGVEYVKEVIIEKIKLDTFELSNVVVYAHTFPQESFSTGVLGLNVLTEFDVNLIFSEKRIQLTIIDPK